MNKRIGNDIIVKWSLKNGGEPFLIEGADVSLYLRGGSGTEKLTDFTVSGNLITWIFRGKNQRCTGKHSLILIINEGKDGMITTDACPFVNLVACSNQQGGSDYPNIEIESVEIESELEMVNGQMIVVDSALSLTSPNPVQNAVVTAELEKKVNSSDLATINGKRIDEGGNIEIEGGSGSLTAEEVLSTEPTAAFPQLLYTEQELSDAQKEQARKNIGVSEAIEESISSAITNVLNEEV